MEILFLTIFALCAATATASITTTITATGPPPNKRVKTSDVFKLSIIHINDLHSRFEETNEYGLTCKSFDKCVGGLGRTIAAVKSLKEQRPNPIFLNAGDNFMGTFWYLVGRHAVVSELLNIYPADATALGNHELDNGCEGAFPYIKELKSPMLVANANLSELNEWKPYIKSSITIDRAGRKIGIIGVLGKDSRRHSSSYKLKLNDEIQVVREEAKKLAEGKDKVKIIIVLSHCGLEVDYKIAQQSGEHIDIIVGGHSHSFMYTKNEDEKPPGVQEVVDTYPAVVKQEKHKGRKVLIVQACSLGRYVGDLVVDFDDNGEIVDWIGNPIYLDTHLPKDDAVMQVMDKFRKQYDAIRLEKVIETTFDLKRGSCRSQECAIGNLLTDIYLNYQQNEWKNLKLTSVKPSIGIIHAAYIRSEFTKGNITYGDFADMLPFSNTIDAYELTGEDLWTGFEHCFKKIKTLNPLHVIHFLQVSGMKYTVNPSNVEGRRIVSIEVLEGEGSQATYKPIDKKKSYGVVTAACLTELFTSLADGIKDIRIGEFETKVVQNYLKPIGKLDEIKLTGRVTVQTSDNK